MERFCWKCATRILKCHLKKAQEMRIATRKDDYTFEFWEIVFRLDFIWFQMTIKLFEFHEFKYLKKYHKANNMEDIKIASAMLNPDLVDHLFFSRSPKSTTSWVLIQRNRVTFLVTVFHLASCYLFFAFRSLYLCFSFPLVLLSLCMLSSFFLSL